MSRLCTIPGCGRWHYARGWCKRHYDRWVNHDDPLAIVHCPGDIEPRYCTCYGDDITPPTPMGECPDCGRLVEAMSA